MALVQDPIPNPVPVAEDGARQAIRILKQMANGTSRQLTTLRNIKQQFGGVALNQAITDLGFNSAELQGIYDAFKTAVETADVTQSVPAL